MPNRIMREGWVESHPIDSLTGLAEMFFFRLCLRADDFGRFHAHPQLLKSSLFPLKDGVRCADMSRCLAECEKAGLVRCYEHAGKRFLVIVKFNQRIRAENSKFPAPPEDDGHMAVISQTAAHGDGDGDEGVCEGGKPPRTPEAFARPPTKAEAVAMVAALRADGADYTDTEAVKAWLSFEAAKNERGLWRWGKNTIPPGDPRAALETKIGDLRNRKESHGNIKTGKQNTGDRNAGTANEGRHSDYSRVGKVV